MTGNEQWSEIQRIAIQEALTQAAPQIVFQLGGEGKGRLWEREGEQLQKQEERISYQYTQAQLFFNCTWGANAKECP